MRYCLVVLAVVALASCSGDAATTTTGPSPSVPEAVVAAWVGAIEAGDATQLEALVEPVGMTLVAGIENDLQPAELAELLNGGIPAELAAQYWESYRDEFRNFTGVTLADLHVAGATQLSSGDLVAVELAGDDGSISVMVRTDGDRPQIDMAATLAAPLARRFGSYLGSILDTPESVTIGSAYRSTIVPALEALVAQNDSAAELAFDLEYIKQLLADIPAG